MARKLKPTEQTPVSLQELPRTDELPRDLEELTTEQAEAAQGGLTNTSFKVNTLTFSSNATGIG